MPRRGVIAAAQGPVEGETVMPAKSRRLSAGPGRAGTTAVALALSASIMAGCSSGSTSAAKASSVPGSSVTNSTPTTGATATTSAAGGQVPKSCPPASIVNVALGQKDSGPALTQEPFGISCSYTGSGAVSTKIDFQQDTSASFAAGEKAVPMATIVSGLGDAAYMSSGFLAVLHGTYSIRVLSAFSSEQQLEALARKLLA